jgi:hypothetical protein
MDSESKKMGVHTNDPASAAVDLPMDLSNPKKITPAVGPEPTSPQEKPAFVKKRWLAQSQAATTKFIPLQNIRNAVKRRAHEMDSFTTATTTTTTTSSTTGDSASLQSSNMQQWDLLGLRLDRANSVPYLSVLPPLQRQKSLSESRIAPKIATPTVPPNYAPLSSTEDKTVRWLIDHQQELQRQRMQQMDLMQQYQEPAEINLNYYSKMVQFMQNQEILRVRGAATTRAEEDDGYDENDDDECPELADIDYSSSPSQVITQF